MKNLTTLLLTTIFIATFGFGQPTMTIATTLEITPEVTTFAGSGSAGSADGTGTAASFYKPSGVAVDGSGNVYVAEYYNHLIRKITSAGVVTTLAGSGSAGSANGTGTAASFYRPYGVAVDGNGNVYVADYYNHLIRKITSAGVVTTLAGSGSQGSADGTGTAASFYNPSGVAVDGSGNVYVADRSNHLIRKITSADVVTTLAGSGSQGSANGTGTAASFTLPYGVAVDASGNVYVADSGNNLIRKIATTLASGSTTNDATLPLIFTSSEATTDFAEEDITVTNGALSDFAATSSTVYTATFTPTASRSATINVAASTFTDAVGNNNTAATQYTWTKINNAPVASDETITTDEDIDYTGTLSGTDIDALTFAVVDSSVNGIVTISNASTGAYTYSPTADYNGSDSLTYSVSDGTLLDTAKVSITVNSVNDAPIAAVYPDTSILEDDTLTVMFSATDVDEDSLSFGVAGPTDNPDITVSNFGAGFNVFASPNWHGDAEIRIDVWDGALADTAYFTLTVNPVNDAPVMSALADTTINEDGAIEIVLTASDIYEDTLTFSAASDTSAVIVAVSTDTLSVSPADNWNGTADITVIVTDGALSDTTSFELTVNAVNDAPSSFALNEQDSVYITMANFDSDSIVFTWDESADVDEDELTYHFTAELVINGQLTTEYDTTLTANAMKIDYQSVFDEIYAAQAMLAGMEWDVSVSDGVEEVMADENGPLTVGVNASDAVLSIDEELLPEVYALHQNYPNPFNPITTLRYDLPEQANVNIIIYDMLGRQVRTLLNQTQDAGYRSVIWNATNDYGKPVSAGVYLYKIQAGSFVQTKKMVLLK